MGGSGQGLGWVRAGGETFWSGGGGETSASGGADKTREGGEFTAAGGAIPGGKYGGLIFVGGGGPGVAGGRASGTTICMYMSIMFPNCCTLIHLIICCFSLSFF